MKLKAQWNNELADMILFDIVGAEEFQRSLTAQLSEYISKEVDQQIAKLKQKGEVMIKKYVKRPIPIQAIQFTGDNGVWIQENFCPKFKGTLTMWWDPDKQIKGIIQQEFKCWIETLQGNMVVKVGDYVVRGSRGQFYSCDRDIFRESYDQI